VGTKKPVREPLSIPKPARKDEIAGQAPYCTDFCPSSTTRCSRPRRPASLVGCACRCHCERGVGVPEPGRDDRHRHVVLQVHERAPGVRLPVHLGAAGAVRLRAQRVPLSWPHGGVLGERTARIILGDTESRVLRSRSSSAASATAPFGWLSERSGCISPTGLAPSTLASPRRQHQAGPDDAHGRSAGGEPVHRRHIGGWFAGEDGFAVVHRAEHVRLIPNSFLVS
jgi:hypothetical protein